MDAYEATKVVFSRIQALDPDHAAKIMGFLLIQDHGEKEMIRLAFGPEALLHTVMAKARKDLGLLPPPAPGSGPGTPTSAAHSPFLLSRQNSGRCGAGAGTAPSPLSVSSPSSWAPPPVFSRSNSVISNGAVAEEALTAAVGDDLMSPAAGGNAPPSPFFAAGDPLLDELQLQEQLAFLNDAAAGHQLPLFDAASECRSPGAGDATGFFPYGGLGWANGGGPGHRRSSSVSELCLGGADGLGWKPCLYYARGYCKNGSACRFVHGGLPDDATALAGAKMDTATLEQQCQDILLRSKSQRLAAAAFPYSPTGSLPGSPSAATKCLSLLLQQQQNENQRAAAAAAAAALMLGGDDAHKFLGRPRLDRADLASMMNPGSRQIYLTFPADSTFREEDVSNYFSIYGPVHDVRIPYQQKRMFGFVTFVYPETVKLILAKGNPHFICDARVLVKPYKEKGKVPDKYRKQQLQGERVDFSNGLDARDHFDLHQLGARMLQHSHSANEMLLRRKLEEQQQQAAELQQAMELQSRRLMGLQLLDLKTRSSPSPIGMPFSPTRAVASATVESPPDSAGEHGPKGSSGFFLPQRGERPAVNGGDKEESAGDASPNADGDQSAEHNLPDSPFASPTKKSAAAAFSRDPFAPSDSEIAATAAASPGRNATAASFAGINNGGGLTGHLRPSALDIPSPKPYFFPMSRLSSDHGAGAIGM
ncbi:zinc finger CCCH domain-containing protein 53 isoform X1 [Sorghum bicolor]|uniref:zinc finger CCCH domain-containing protein 53 isoform X1 n=1 Tax=Sorghum bicolor TaxID=4558 RepID=UPI000B4254F1|nr:zinc finger CCCH domain-containing protein 53 isoform X1 [Sorghum bicolor]|eukprot:XP_021309506.1 zinc finger CCCH domain-containing protein 53 isoform X1 [Sorghum bicolor]